MKGIKLTYDNKVINTSDFPLEELRYIGMYTVLNSQKGKDTTYCLFTTDLTTPIEKCVPNRYSCFPRTLFESYFETEYKRTIDLNPSYTGLTRKIGFVLGDKLLGRTDNTNVIQIGHFDIFVSTLDASIYKQFFKFSKILMLNIQEIKYNFVTFNTPFCSGAPEWFRRIIKTFESVVEVKTNNKFIVNIINKFLTTHSKEIKNISDIFSDILEEILGSLYLNKFNKKQLYKLNSLVYSLTQYEYVFKNLYELLIKICEYTNINIEKHKIHRILEKQINVTEKIIKKTTVKAHIRKVKMTNSKRSVVLNFLEDNNLLIDSLGLITKDNFNDYDWSKMTIVEGFEKNTNYINVDDNPNLTKYFDKEREKQKKIEKANHVHQNLVRQMAYTLEVNNLKPCYNRLIDLYSNLKDSTIIFEMKSITSNNCYSQLMKGFSQLMAYPYMCDMDKDIHKCIVLGEKPSETRFEQLFKDNNINVIWLEGSTFNTYAWTNTTVIKLLMNQAIITKTN